MQDVFAPAPVKVHNDLAHKVIYEMELKSKNKVRVSEKISTKSWQIFSLVYSFQQRQQKAAQLPIS